MTEQTIVTVTRSAGGVELAVYGMGLAFSIGFAITRSRALLRRLLIEHAPDDARQQLAASVVEHLEQVGF